MTTASTNIATTPQRRFGQFGVLGRKDKKHSSHILGAKNRRLDEAWEHARSVVAADSLCR